MKQSQEVQYWDSALFINLITKRDAAKVAAIREMWRDAEHGRATIVLSNLVLVEVRPKTGFEEGYREVVTSMLEANWSFVQWYAISREIALAARDLAIDFPGLLPADAIHVATAQIAKADVFLTFDGAREPETKRNRRTKGLLGFNGLIGAPALRIEQPRVGYGMSMFDEYVTPAAITPPARAP